jgi:hypothetical protein
MPLSIIFVSADYRITVPFFVYYTTHAILCHLFVIQFVMDPKKQSNTNADKESCDWPKPTVEWHYAQKQTEIQTKEGLNGFCHEGNTSGLIQECGIWKNY